MIFLGALGEVLDRRADDNRQLQIEVKRLSMNVLGISHTISSDQNCEEYTK